MTVSFEENFFALLDAERLQAKALQLCLENEKNALERQDLKQLEAASQKKTACYNELKSLDEAYHQLLKASGNDLNRKSMQDIIMLFPENRSLKQCWEEFKKSIEACKRQNQINGKLLASSQQAIKRNLNILLGEKAPTLDLYDQTGKISAS